jgi:NDP-sugar pyrophosphorylase family protein
MQAIIFADRLGSELAPLCDTTPVALLPLANRPLLEYTLDDLAAAGIEEAFVVSAHTRLLEAHFARGEMWGIRLHYLLSRGEESPQQLIERNRNLLQTPFLALRGDVLRSPSCVKLLQAGSENSRSVAISQLQIGGSNAGALLVNQLPEQMSRLNALAWPLTGSELQNAVVDHHGDHFSCLDSFGSFYHASMQTVEGEFALHTPPVQEIDPGLRVGANGEVAAMSRESGVVLVGEQSRIDPQVRLLGPAIIGNHCYIDSGATLVRSIILPGSYVGAGLQVENAIISGHHLIRIDHNVAMTIHDPSMIAYVDHEVESLLYSLPDRLMGLALLLLSLPLWPLALLLSVINNRAQPLKRVTILGNRSNPETIGRERLLVDGWQMATGIPLLRSLPLLWLVARGDLRLFGSTPLQPEGNSDAATRELPCWDLRQHHCSAGLLGPAQLDLPRSAPEEELRLNESHFIEQRGLTTLLQRLFKASILLFTSRAWYAGGHTHALKES